MAWIDHLKALAILLVVYGHSYAVDWGIGHWIYAFHLPLFFLLSGFLESDKSLSLNFKDFLSKHSRALLVPYVVFAVIGYSAWLAVLRHVGADADSVATAWYRPVLATLYGSGSQDGFHMIPIVLWFLPCLLIAKLLVFGLAKLGTLWRLLGSVALAVLGFSLPQTIFLPMEIEDALVAQLFVYIGVCARRAQWFDRSWNLNITSISLFVVGSILAFTNGKIDMRISEYGNPLLFILSACLISFGLMGIARAFLTKSLFISRQLAQHTILIFPLHPLVFSAFNAVYVYLLSWDISMRSQPIVGLIATLANVSLLLIIAPLAKNKLPWIYGSKIKNLS